MFIVEKIISSATCIVDVGCGGLDWLGKVAGFVFCTHVFCDCRVANRVPSVC